MSAVKLSALFVIVTVLNLLKGGPDKDGRGGPVSLAYCGVQWSILNRVRSGGPILSEIEWDEEKTITYPPWPLLRGWWRVYLVWVEE